MSTLTESLKRLIAKGIRTVEDIDKLLTSGKISQEEYDYITE